MLLLYLVKCKNLNKNIVKEIYILLLIKREALHCYTCDQQEKRTFQHKTLGVLMATFSTCPNWLPNEDTGREGNVGEPHCKGIFSCADQVMANLQPLQHHFYSTIEPSMPDVLSILSIIFCSFHIHMSREKNACWLQRAFFYNLAMFTQYLASIQFRKWYRCQMHLYHFLNDAATQSRTRHFPPDTFLQSILLIRHKVQWVV